jgi:DNA (cytosine-5)-methyltransferase 1
VAIAWFSPDCKHHSKAKGGKPREQKIRGLAWVAVRWAAAVKPRVIALENVEEFQDWGPLHGCHTDGCTGDHPLPDRDYHGYPIERVDEDGEPIDAALGCLPTCRKGRPIIARKGETFRAFVRRLERLGYTVEWKLLRACDYGAPTTRRRLFLVARRDGRAIVWPEPTHGPRRARPFRTAAECIDWTIPCPSIFLSKEEGRELGVNRPLADKTLARIARGIRKYVIDSASPFIVPTNHGGVGRDDRRVHAIGEPMRTVTSHGRGALALVAPTLIQVGYGEREGQAPRTLDLHKPLGVVVAGGGKHALVAAFLAKHYGDRPTGGWPGGASVADPFSAITVRDHHSVVAAHLMKFYGTSTGAPLDAPTPTVTSGGWKLAQVCAFLVKYYGCEEGQDQGADRPLDAVTTRDRFALVTVMIDGEPYLIVDIGMRMLTPRELFRAQGFPDSYEIAPVWNGKPLTRTAQIRMCGNSVCPPLAAAVVRAQLEAA